MRCGYYNFQCYWIECKQNCNFCFSVSFLSVFCQSLQGTVTEMSWNGSFVLNNHNKNFTVPQHHNDVRNLGDVEAYQGYHCHHFQVPHSLAVPVETVVQLENDDIFDKKSAAFLNVMPACRLQMKQCRLVGRTSELLQRAMGQGQHVCCTWQKI